MYEGLFVYCFCLVLFALFLTNGCYYTDGFEVIPNEIALRLRVNLNEGVNSNFGLGTWKICGVTQDK